MDSQTKEHWQKLCEQVAVEKDPAVLLALCLEINRILEEKENRLKQLTKVDSRQRDP